MIKTDAPINNVRLHALFITIRNPFATMQSQPSDAELHINMRAKPDCLQFSLIYQLIKKHLVCNIKLTKGRNS